MCSDITLTMANMTMSDACVNGTGITTGPSQIVGNPNNTAPSGASGDHTHKARGVVEGRTGEHVRRLTFST
jgi:hypothetical protein